MKTGLMLAFFVLMIAMLGSVYADSGAIWTTKGDCGTQEQDVNHYAVGEHVFINGDGFAQSENFFVSVKQDAETNSWDITGQPGHASCDPGIIVANGTHTLNPDGSFCFDAYTVQPGDCGEYDVTFDNKHDNYRVDDPSVPEFGVIAGSVALLGAIGAVLYKRR